MSNEKNVNSQKKHFGKQKKDDKIQAFIEVYKIYREVKSKNYNPKNEKSDLKKDLQQWEQRENNHKKNS